MEPVELVELLKQFGISETVEGEECLFLSMDADQPPVEFHLRCDDSTSEARDGATLVATAREQLAGTVEHVIHRLHLAEVVLVPVKKWRNVFDAVAFSLAANEDWQEVDAAATVELNTRDPLLCEAADYPLLVELVNALLQDAESPEQGLFMVTTSMPLLIEVIPDGAIRVTIGSPQIADELVDILSPA
ncbi:MAG: hypothetical protein AAF432_12745 [Planctomycetota bacterium]